MTFLANPRCGDVFQKLLKKVFIILTIQRALQGKKILTIFNRVIKFRIFEKANLTRVANFQVRDIELDGFYHKMLKFKETFHIY